MRRQHCNRKVVVIYKLVGKQDTYYLEIKEDLGKFYCFLMKKPGIVSHREKRQQIELDNQDKMNI